MKVCNFISLASAVFFLTGCVNMSSLGSSYESMTYESTVSSPNIGYIDYQSSDLLNNFNRELFVIVSYLGENGAFDTEKTVITHVHPKNGYLRIYIPFLKKERFDTVDLNIDFGTVRVISSPLNGAESEFKRLDRGKPIELTLENKKITITSGITLPGTYSAILLKNIKK